MRDMAVSEVQVEWEWGLNKKKVRESKTRFGGVVARPEIRENVTS